MDKIQVSNSESLPPSFITTYSQDNNILIASPRQSANWNHVTSASQTNYDNTQMQPPQQTLQTTPAQQTNPSHPTDFFYQPSNDFCHYYVSCKEICYDTVTYLLNKSLKENNIQSNENECIFYYQQQYDARFYQVSCEIVSPLLINNCLNKNFLGIELQQNMEQEQFSFTFDQKKILNIV